MSWLSTNLLKGRGEKGEGRRQGGGRMEDGEMTWAELGGREKSRQGMGGREEDFFLPA